MEFSANGRTNNVSLERRLEWQYNSSKGNFSADLKDFNWNNNGWLKDNATNKDCLRISNGASVEIPF
jgi:hypothetical protein